MSCPSAVPRCAPAGARSNSRTSTPVSFSAPATATTGATGTVSLGFTGLAAATRYLGAVNYSGIAGLPTTMVRIDTP